MTAVGRQVPSTEFSDEFVQKMKNRMSVSFYKYGPVSQNFPEYMNALGSLERCLEKYRATKNTEYLVDAANYCMIEFMRPREPGAYFKATDSEGSAGRVAG